MSSTVAFSKSAVNVFFHLLTRCNLSCRHCYINPEQHGRETLPLPVIKEWLGAFCHKSHMANVIFLGGEPTLHPQLADAVKAARAMGFASITIDTNGYLFNDILSRVTPDEVDFFSFSLDGATRETNDRLRGEGCYDRCLAGIRQAVERGFNTSLIYTVSGTNLGELTKMPDLLGTLGIDRFFIQVIGLRGRAAAGGQGEDAPFVTSQVDSDSWQRIVPEVAEKVAAMGIFTVYPKVFLSPEETFECAGLAADNYFIFPNGRVYRCPLCEDHPLHSFVFNDGRLEAVGGINESDLFHLRIPEGCVMNKLLQPGNISYGPDGAPLYKIACCMLKLQVE
jgi:MoaA/NifB/PqqE/SkfB family radical SAM enzyme